MIFQGFHDFQSLWEPCTNVLEVAGQNFQIIISLNMFVFANVFTSQSTVSVTLVHFLGVTSIKQSIKCFAQRHNTEPPVSLEPET